jgi:dipeptidase
LGRGRGIIFLPWTVKRMIAASVLSSLLLPSFTHAGAAAASVHSQTVTSAGVATEDHRNEYFYPKDQCTALAVGPKAMADGSTIATHNNDCQECDIRITHVPARDWKPGSRRPIFDERMAYPRFLETSENNVHGPSYVVGTEDSTIYPWKAQEPIFHIDQVPHTYAYTMGSYPLQNEKQLSMGESTCFTTMWSTPITMGGKAAFNVRSLMEIAMERCDSARCAIQLMGDLAVKYGFFCYEGEPSAHADCSEAVTISDPNEAWLFHVNADDTHESAVWVAQRVPDDEIAAIANMFVISTIDLSKPDYFMASPNVYDAATRSGLWSPDSGEEFSYLKVYGVNPGASADGCTRRVWRVFTLANPSLPLSPFTDGYGSYGYGEDGSKPYPFSVKPEKPLALQDIFTILRDNYDGTEFDLMDGVDAGPFGDVLRSGPNTIRTVSLRPPPCPLPCLSRSPASPGSGQWHQRC